MRRPFLLTWLALTLSGCALLIGDLSLPPLDGPADETADGGDGGEVRDAAPPRFMLPELHIEEPEDLAAPADLAEPPDGRLDSPADGGQN